MVKKPIFFKIFKILVKMSCNAQRIFVAPEPTWRCRPGIYLLFGGVKSGRWGVTWGPRGVQSVRF